MITEEKCAYNRAYYQQNRERLIADERARYHADVQRTRAMGRSRYASDPDRFRSTAKRSAAKHKLRIAVYNAKYHAEHKEEIAEVSKTYRQRNADAIRASHRDYYRRNPKKVLALNRKWIVKNPHKQTQYDARQRALEKSASVQERKAIDSFYKLVRFKKTIPCYYCGKLIRGTDAHIDHIVALSKSGNHAVENLCTSCPTCNHSKSNKSLKDWDRHDQKFLPL